MITKRVSFFAISLSLGLGLTLALAVKPRKNVGRPQTTQRASQLADRKMRAVDPNPGKPTREQLVEEARLAFLNKPYQGNSIKPHLKATGEDLEVQSPIAALITKANITPPSRLDHFAWLTNSPEFRINGWDGQITSVKPTAGGWSVEVVVRPNLDSMKAGRSIVTGDYYKETYFYDGRNTRYVAGESPPTNFQSLIMD